MENNNATAVVRQLHLAFLDCKKRLEIFFARPSKLPKPTVITCKMAQQKESDNVVLPFSIIATTRIV